MPVAPTYPGVYIEEIPSGVRTIVGVSTSTGAFVDYFPQGPMNEAVQIFSWADFERIFGGLDTKSEASYAIQQFFLNGGTTAYVVRTTSGTSSNAAKSAAIVLQDGAGNNILLATAASPGLWGNQLRIDINFGATDPSTLFNLTVTEVSFTGGTPSVVATESFRNVTLDSTATNYVVEIVNARSQLITLQSLGTSGRPEQTGTVSGGFSALSLPAWQPGHVFALGTQVLDANGNLEKVTTAGTSLANPPAWPTTVNSSVVEGAVTWTLINPPHWSAHQAFLTGDEIVDSNGNVQQVTTPGTSGGVAPAWATTPVGATTPDGGVTWTLVSIGSPAWAASHAFSLGNLIVDSNGKWEVVTLAGTSGATAPTWPTTLNATVVDGAAGSLAWTLVATGVGVVPSWSPRHAYAVGNQIVDSNGNIEVVTVAGSSGPTAPAWPTVVGTTTVDGTVTWKLIPTGTGSLFPAWSSTEPYAVGAKILDSNGNLQRVTVAGTSGTAPPAWNTTIGATTTDGTVTWALVSPTRLAVDLADTMSATLNANPAFTTHIQLNAGGPPPAISVGWLAATLQSQIRGVDPSLSNATVTVVGSASTEVFLQIKPGTMNPSDFLTLTDVTGGLATALGLTTNVQQYALGSGVAIGAQALPGGVASPGSNGTWDPTTDAAGVAQGLIGDQLLKTGMYALLDADLFNILCIPVTALLPDTDAAQVAVNATSLCTQRRAFYLLDPPQEDGDRDTLDGIKSWLDQNGSLRSRNSALYFPRVDIADALNGFRLRTTATSGTIAGLYARIDVARGVWKAPAGIEASLGGVQNMEYKLTDGENGVLNPLAINCLRTFPVYGPVCWGARTLFGADQLVDDYKYVPVRRFALFLEESLFRGTKWVVFEPNDEPLWAQIRLNIGAFMQSLFRQGAFQGTSPRDAYLVKCDSQTTTQTDINSGIVNIVVGFAPLKPAEFVILKIQQLAGQIPT
jgi:phage tail sheath protein FI